LIPVRSKDQRRCLDHPRARLVQTLIFCWHLHVDGDLFDNLRRGRLVETKPARETVQPTHQALDRGLCLRGFQIVAHGFVTRRRRLDGRALSRMLATTWMIGSAGVP
jgi:hypothetical protein